MRLESLRKWRVTDHADAYAAEASHPDTTAIASNTWVSGAAADASHPGG